MERRQYGSYIWVTWISALLSGDKHCRWAAWLKAHYNYEKLGEDSEAAARLKKWKGEHVDLVAKRVAELRAEGWDVFVEGENKFNVRGKVATLAGGPDIVATRAAVEDQDRAFALSGEIAIEPRTETLALVEDCKSGSRRDSDYHQVVIYMTFLGNSHKQLKGKGWPLSGAVVYADGGRLAIPPEHAGPDAVARIVAQIQETGGPNPPARVPSTGECKFCDIAACPERVSEETAPIDTELF